MKYRLYVTRLDRWCNPYEELEATSSNYLFLEGLRNKLKEDKRVICTQIVEV